MDQIVLMLIFAGIQLIGHGIFTGLALVATWYFGRMAEKKLLKEAQGIHKEVTDKIAKMDAAEAEYDKIDAFLEQQGKILTGFRSEITRVMANEVGAVIDEKIKAVNAPGGPQAKASTTDRLLAVAENIAASMVMGAAEG